MNRYNDYSGADVDPDLVDQSSGTNTFTSSMGGGRQQQWRNAGHGYTGADHPQGAVDPGMDPNNSYANPSSATGGQYAGLGNEQNVGGGAMGGAFGNTRSGQPTSGIDKDYYTGGGGGGYNQPQGGTTEHRHSIGDMLKEGYEKLTGKATTTSDQPMAPHDERLA